MKTTPNRKKRHPRKLVAVLIATALGLGTTGCALTDGTASDPTSAESSAVAKVDSIADMLPQKTRETGVVNVAALAGLAPMMFIGADGRTMDGVEADLLKAAGQVLDVKIDLHDTKPEAFMAGIVSGRFDLAAGSLTYTAERAKKVDFVVYADYAQGLAKSATNDEDISFDSLCGRSVGVATGSVQQNKFLPEISKACTKEKKPAVKPSVFPDVNAMFLAVKSGRVDAAFLNEVAVRYQADHSNGALVVADTGLGNDPKGLAVSRSSGVGEAFQAALENLRQDGTMDEIFTDWGIDSVLSEQVQYNPAL